MYLTRFFTLLAALAITIAGCTTESKFPVATGKGNVRMINAIKGSPLVVLKIEEITFGSAEYKDTTTPRRWDDLSYVFNFEVPFPDQIGLSRIAARELKVEADRDYTFIMTGQVTRPTITLVESDEKDWGETDAIFEARFMHLAPSLGAVDVYFGNITVPPAAGEEVASLSNGEIEPNADFPIGEYVVTITTAGDPTDILYDSTIGIFAARTSWTIALFDGDENDLHPIAVRGFPTVGSTVPFADRNTPPEVRFVQASLDLPLADIYEDELLTSLLHEDQAFGDVTPYEQIDAGVKRITYTPADDIGSTLFSADLLATIGSRFDFFALGELGDNGGIPLFAERRSVSTEARLRFIQASINQGIVNIYVVPEGETLDGEVPDRVQVAFSTASDPLSLAAGDHDIYVTPFGDQTILDGPFPLSLALGDTVDMMILDRVDPALVELRILPPN